MKKWMLIISSLMLLGACISYSYLPDTIPIHWGIDGTADSFAGKLHVFSPVAISWMFTIGLLVASYRTKKTDKSRKGMMTLFLLLNVVMFLIMVMTIWQSIAPDTIDAKLIAFPLMTLIFMTTGNMMPKIKANHFIGIRTPWTLGNEYVWYKTHRFSGKVWFFGGFLSLIGTFIPASLLEGFLIFLIILMIVVPCLYSCICFYSSKNQHYPK